MNSLSITFKRFTQNYIGQLIAVLIVFAICRVVALSVFYYGFLQTFEKACHVFFEATPAFLSHIPFYSGSILLSSLLHPFFLITLIVFYFPFYLKRKELREKISNPSSSTRLIVFVSAFILVWELCTYDYNFYLNNAFYFDRIVLVLLVFALWRYPVLVPLFVAFAFVYRSQFNFPVAGFELHDKRLLFDIQVMFVVFMYAKLYISEFKIPFIYFVLCIVASNYFMSGVEKIVMSPHGYEWLLNNDPSNLFTNVHYRGWMAKSGENAILNITGFLEQFGKLFQVLVLVVELAALFLLRSRKWAIAILIMSFSMHAGIFIFGSMLFWKWMVVDLVLAIILLKEGNELDGLFSKQNFRAYLFVIFLSGLWLRPIMIGWHDTPVNQYFSYEVEDKDGNIYQLDKNQMNPYHQWFQYDHFLFLVNRNCLPVTGFGYTNKYKVAEKIRSAQPENYLKLEEEFGKNNYDALQKQKYDEFINAFFKNRNQRLEQTFLPNYLKAPDHLYSSVAENEYLNQKPVHKFRVVFNQVYTQHAKAVVINKEIIDEIVIQ